MPATKPVPKTQSPAYAAVFETEGKRWILTESTRACREETENHIRELQRKIRDWFGPNHFLGVCPVLVSTLEQTTA